MNMFSSEKTAENILYKSLENINAEYSHYRQVTEERILKFTDRITKLERDADMAVNVIEAGKYVNSILGKPNMESDICDMLIGIFGTAYASIYVCENENLFCKATNIKDISHHNELIEICKLTKNPYINNEKKSIVAAPLTVSDHINGYVILEHESKNFFKQEKMVYLSSICSQIAIALESNNLYRRLIVMANSDPLLNIYNRRYFFKTVGERPKGNYVISLIDIDDFKKCNDLFGHQFGDEVLIQTAKIINNNLSEGDIFARYGGEELIIFEKDASDIQTKYTHFDKIRDAISRNVVNYNGMNHSVTISIGLAFGSGRVNIDTIIENADKAMYVSKKNGKNKVTIFT